MTTSAVADAEPALAAEGVVAQGSISHGSYREVLGVGAFRLLWAALSGSVLGAEFGSIALPLLAFAVTGSAVLASQIFVASMVPRIVLSPIAGVFADRLDRRRVMMGCDLWRCGLVALYPFATQGWQLALIATLVALGNTLARPAELAAVPQVVPPQLLVRAISLVQVTNSTVRVIGPALGAAVIAVAGPRPAFLVQAASFLVSFLVLSRLRLPAVDRAATERSLAGVWADLKEGLSVSLRHPMVRGTAMVEMLWALVAAVFAIALVVFVTDSLGYGDRAGPLYALMMAAIAAGATGGALVAGRIEQRIGRGRMMAAGYFAPLLLVAVALRPPLPVLFAVWFLLGFGDAWAVIATQAYLAEAVGDEMRGRVYAVWIALVAAGAALAFLIVGRLTNAIGAIATIGLTGLVVGIGGPCLIVLSGAAAEIRRRHAAVG